MRTSKQIKKGQYNARPVVRIGSGTFRAQSWDGTHQHTVRRIHDRFLCDCPATSLCHHVIDVVVDSARARGWKLVQLWTDEQDARRQKRRRVEYVANGAPFWVTYANRQVDPLEGVAIVAPLWGEAGVELVYQDGRREVRPGLDIKSLRIAAESAGWFRVGASWVAP